MPIQAVSLSFLIDIKNKSRWKV